MENFLKALHKTLKWEGGLSNHSSDSGGITYRGVSLRFLKAIKYDINKDGNIDELDVKNINDNVLLYIYKTYFWDKVKAEQINSFIIQSHLFDIAVNSGAKQAIKLIQKACNTFDCDLKVDGIIGNKTMTAINSIDSMLLNSSLGYERILFYNTIILKNPKYKVFEKGWMNRAKDFLFKEDGDENEFV